MNKTTILSFVTTVQSNTASKCYGADASNTQGRGESPDENNFHNNNNKKKTRMNKNAGARLTSTCK
uniref:Uncharacterized protein n=1 Tax=Romanomermis culicivorax TaxID=13658 RepID=A0A915HTY2_ROMCU